MTTWIIGDVQGCYDGMMLLLDKVGFDDRQDQLWSVGDLVNRGSQSLAVLRFCKNLGERFVCTLGNHDLHMLAVAHGCSHARPKDNFQPVLEASDSIEILDWLQRQPLIYYDEPRQLLLSHAGIAPMWTLQQALSYASEVADVLRADEVQYQQFFSAMYGNQPDCWNGQLIGLERLRTITNYLTRMRFVNASGALNMALKGGLDEGNAIWKAWFQLPHLLLDNSGITSVIGHWAALEGVCNHPQVEALDTGYVWGGTLTVMNAQTRERVSYQHG